MKKRFLSILLVLCMVLTLFSPAAFAEETGAAIGASAVTQDAPLCENHETHDPDCGYIEAKDAQPCGHLNEGGEYSCAPELDSGKAADEYNCDHSDGCGFAEAVEGKPCTHACELCKDVPPALLAATPRAAGYSYDHDTGTLTVSTNDGTTAWFNDSNITKADVTTVVIESGVTAIGDVAFAGCQLLESVTIPSGVTTIGIGAFSGCTKLDSVTFAPGSQLETIGNSAFQDCTSLESVTIPSGVTTIDDAAFNGCTSLESVTIPSNVAHIGSQAFRGCTKLDSVTFESVTPPSFGMNVFDKSIASTLKIYVPTADAVTAYKDVANLATWKNRIVVVGSSAIIGEGYSYDPDSKTLTIFSDIGTNAWKGSNTGIARTDVTTVVIESGVTDIGFDSFDGCTGLESVTIANGVLLISQNAFYGCTSLASVIIPESVTSIGESAFRNCTSLESVTIPSDVNKIDISAFQNCSKLASVTFEGATPPATFETGVFANTHADLKIYVPAASVDAYKAKLTDYVGKIVATIDYSFEESTNTLTITKNTGTTAWRNDVSIPKSNVVKVVIESGVDSIGDKAFYECENLTSVTIPEGVTTIGSNAFGRCTSLASVTIPGSVTTIGIYAFFNCTDLTSVTILSGVPSIGEAIFSDCTSLTSVTIPSSVTAIGNAAFHGCTSLASVTIPGSVTTIGSGAFNGCTSLASVTIPEGVTTIGRSVFAECTNLASVTFKGPTPPATFGTNVFTDTADTLKIYVPSAAAVTAYKNVANLATWKEKIEAKSGYSYDPDTATLTIFSNAGTTEWSALDTGISLPDVTKVDIQYGVTAIGDNAFNLCNNLANVTIPSSVTSIGDKAFGGCTVLANVTIPSNVTTIGKNAFSQCVNLASVTFEGATPPSFGTEVFTSTPSTLKIYVPSAAAVALYKEVANLATWKEKIVAKSESTTKITNTLYLRDISADVKCTDSDVADKITGMTQHTHPGNTPCWAWNNTTSTLTLNNVNIEASSGDGVVLPSVEATVKFSGSNHAKGAAVSSGSKGIGSYGSITLTGATEDATLAMSGEERGLGTASSITITEGIVTSTGTGTEGPSYGIFGVMGVVVSGGTVTATTASTDPEASAILAIEVPMRFYGGRVTAKAGAGARALSSEPILSNGMIHKAGTGAWDNLEGMACTYEQVVIPNNILHPLDLTNITADAKCTDADVGAKVPNMTPHTHPGNTPCWAWNHATKTLTLNNVNIEVCEVLDVSTYGSGIFLPREDATIAFSGSNTVSGFASEGHLSKGIHSEFRGSLILKGATAAATLNATGRAAGIVISNGTLTITEGVVTATGTGTNGYSFGISARDGITVSGGTVTATSASILPDDAAIWTSLGPITLSGGSVTAKAGPGVKAFSSEPILSNGVVHKAGTGTWDNLEGIACTYEIPRIGGDGGGGEDSPTPSGGGIAGGVTTPGKTVIDRLVGNQGSANALTAAINQAIASKAANATAYTNFANYTALTKAGLTAINDAAAAAVKDKKVTLSTKVQLDNKTGNTVLSRITIDPATLAPVMPQKLGLGVWFDQQKDAPVTAVKSKLAPAFGNSMVVITFEQRTPLQADMEFAAKLDLRGLNTKTLYFYSYNPDTNGVTRIWTPNYWVDESGYTHITAPFGGSIIITDKPLAKK